MKAIILSAGQGRRLLPLTENRPKCLIPLATRSLLEWQLRNLAQAGVREAVVVTGFGADQIEGARRAVRHLIDLGHTEIIHLAGPQDWIEAEARMTGYLREMSAADLETRPPLLGDWTAERGYRVGRELIGARSFTAIFAGNDHMALGLIRALYDAGVRVPEDVSVIGFDDVPEAAYYLPPLTTVRQDFAEVGRRTIAVLLAAIEGQAPLEAPFPAPELIVRGSTGPAPAR